MNRNKAFYGFIVKTAALIGTVILMVWTVGSFARVYTESIENCYRQKSESENFAVPSTVGNGMGLDYIYTLENTDEPKMIIFGSSTSIIGLDTAENYRLIKACSGAATIASYWVMDSFIENIGITPNTQDIIKLDISVVTFKRTSFNNEVLVSALKYGDLYEVNSDGTVTRKPFYTIKKFFVLNARSVEKACEYLQCRIKKGSFDSLFKTTVNNYSQYHKLLNMDNSSKESVIRFIEKYKGNIVVDLMYMSEALKNSEAGSLFNDYADNELIPYLKENSIPYIDSRQAIDEAYFIDNTHLSYAGRRQYEDFINNELKKIKY